MLLPAAARHLLVNWSVLERGRPRVERKVVELPRTHRAGARPRTGARPARRDGHSSLGSAQPRTSLLRASREQLPGRPQEETRLWLKNAEGPFERLCDARVTALDARSRD